MVVAPGPRGYRPSPLLARLHHAVVLVARGLGLLPQAASARTRFRRGTRSAEPQESRWRTGAPSPAAGEQKQERVQPGHGAVPRLPIRGAVGAELGPPTTAVSELSRAGGVDAQADRVREANNAESVCQTVSDRGGDEWVVDPRRTSHRARRGWDTT